MTVDLSLKVDAGVMQAGIFVLGAVTLLIVVAYFRLPIFGPRKEQ